MRARNFLSCLLISHSNHVPKKFIIFFIRRDREEFFILVVSRAMYENVLESALNKKFSSSTSDFLVHCFFPQKLTLCYAMFKLINMFSISLCECFIAHYHIVALCKNDRIFIIMEYNIQAQHIFMRWIQIEWETGFFARY